MPKTVDPRFLRQRATTSEKIGVVIPGNATMKPELAKRIDSLGIDVGKPTDPPHKFSFHYIDYPLDESFLEDGATVDSGVYEFTLRDAVIGVFDLPAFQDDEFSWSFSTTRQIEVLAALRVGETSDVDFEEELDEAYHVTKHHFPPGVPNSGYGEYAIHLGIDGLNGQGFRVLARMNLNPSAQVQGFRSSLAFESSEGQRATKSTRFGESCSVRRSERHSSNDGHIPSSIQPSALSLSSTDGWPRS